MHDEGIAECLQHMHSFCQITKLCLAHTNKTKASRVMSPAGTAGNHCRVLFAGAMRNERYSAECCAGQSDKIQATLKDKFWPTLLAGYAVWPLAHVINFRFIPNSQRVLYINAVNVSHVTATENNEQKLIVLIKGKKLPKIDTHQCSQFESRLIESHVLLPAAPI